MTYKIREPRNRSRKKTILLLILLILLVALAGTLYVYNDTDRDSANLNDDTAQANIDMDSTPDPEPYKSIDLQPVIDNWSARYPASYSISVIDLQNNEVIGQSSSDQKLFAASLYKIYIAYLSLLDFQNETQDPDEILIAGQTKMECVDKMIRSSDSPCGEAMMASMGQLSLNQRVSDMGMSNTTFNGIQTTAADSTLLLKYINQEKDLTNENTNYLLDSMLVQEPKFKRGLQAGASNAKWYTKVGWNEDINYHDIGIMELTDGRRFAVAILAQGSGSPSPIADFASTIYSALTDL